MLFIGICKDKVNNCHFKNYVDEIVKQSEFFEEVSLNKRVFEESQANKNDKSVNQESQQALNNLPVISILV